LGDSFFFEYRDIYFIVVISCPHSVIIEQVISL
jgi:hypothetical protein